MGAIVGPPGVSSWGGPIGRRVWYDGLVLWVGGNLGRGAWGLMAMGASLRLGRVFGIPVEINITWVVIFLLLTWLLANRFDAPGLRWPVAQQWGAAIVTVVLFFLSVLAHELSHSLVAVSRGIRVMGITLFIFGGVSRLEHEPEKPSEEFLVAIVGPMTSIALAAAASGVLFALDSRLWPWVGRNASPAEMVAFLLAWGNLSVGCSICCPAFRWTAGGYCGRSCGRLRAATCGRRGLRRGAGRASGC